jgi:hypothetical protein
MKYLKVLCWRNSCRVNITRIGHQCDSIQAHSLSLALSTRAHT